MNKFLNLVESNLPPQDLDKNREVLRELQQLLSKSGITSSLKTFKDVVVITVNNKVVELELKHISQSTEEEAEDQTAKMIAAVAGLPDQGMKGFVPGTTSNKLAQAKKTMADAVGIMANKFRDAANAK